MKNKKHKKRIYTKSERSSSAKEYLAIIGQQLKRPIEKQDRWIDKKSAILAVVYGVVMAGLAVYSMQTAEKSQEWLWLAVVFISAAIVVNLFRFRYSALIEILLTAFAPAGVFMLVESYTHLLSQMWEGPVILNLIMYYLFFGVLLFITGRTGMSILIGSMLLGAAGLANYFVLMFRSSPILPWDLFSVGVAATVADNFEYKLSVRACNVILLILLLWSLCLKMRLKFKMSKFRGAGIAVMCAAFMGFCGYVQTDAAIKTFDMDTTLFTPTVYYRNNGLALSFIVNLRYLKIDKPEGYSQEELAKIQDEISSGNSDSNVSADNIDLTKKPNIIVIMNEAFSDLSVLGDYTTNTEVMPFISSLSENTQKGWMYSSVKGGNTANTEFEFLTGLSMYFLPTGSIPYQQYIKSEVPSLASQLSSVGYTSVSMHPYYPKGWNRDTVYDDLGFEEKYFKDDFSNPEILRTYISDWTTYQKIISRYEEKSSDERLFVFDVTMQNHGSYVKRYSNFIPDVSVVGGSGTYLKATEQYLSLIKRSDEAFKQLVEYFEKQSEPTIIMMFGDHQPADYITNVVDTGKKTGSNDAFVTSIGTGSDRKERYIVPFVMWANYDINESQGEETSANYLAVRLLKAAGLPLTDFQSYLSDLQQNVPFISAHALKENTGTDCGEEEAEALLKNYKKLLYNDLFDTKHRLQAFYSYE